MAEVALGPGKRGNRRSGSRYEECPVTGR